MKNDFIRTPMGLEVFLHSGEVDEVIDTDLQVPYNDIAGLPNMKPHATAVAYGVGSGSLIALDGNGHQLAWWDSEAHDWHK